MELSRTKFKGKESDLPVTNSMVKTKNAMLRAARRSNPVTGPAAASRAIVKYTLQVLSALTLLTDVQWILPRV